ncbi:MAG TPA: HD domain-containing protein [Syntrophorhabdales bacterium]|nr:HD domain-containing protein [Syntrophorhabdales bacterium]
MIRKALILKIHDAASMQRWNDKIRPVELRELDKQAHKMVISFVLGKFEEENPEFNWVEIIEGGLFEFLQRIIVTDLKPQIFHRIREDQSKYEQLNRWVFEQLAPIILPLGEAFCQRFQSYFENPHENVNKRILSAAHFYATKWEFDIIERANPRGYEIEGIRKELASKQEKYYDLKGSQQLALYTRLQNFADLCGQLRFQLRWSHLRRVPETSVLGHMLIVAILSYLLSLEIKACPRRCYNNYFTGLFHDLPEVLTRDIVHPVKKSVGGLDSLIKEYERERMEEEVYGLIEEDWHKEMRMFTEIEFKSVVTLDGILQEKTSDEISARYNEDRYNPRDGELVQAVDHLAAFCEAYLALANGVKAQDFDKTKTGLKQDYMGKTIAGLRFGEIYSDFD